MKIKYGAGLTLLSMRTCAEYANDVLDVGST